MNDRIRELLLFFLNNRHFVRGTERDKQAPASPHV